MVFLRRQQTSLTIMPESALRPQTSTPPSPKGWAELLPGSWGCGGWGGVRVGWWGKAGQFGQWGAAQGRLGACHLCEELLGEIDTEGRLKDKCRIEVELGLGLENKRVLTWLLQALWAAVSTSHQCYCKQGAGQSTWRGEKAKVPHFHFVHSERSLEDLHSSAG